jgi:hypothetical protein
MSAILERGLTAEQRIEADAADRRMSAQTKALTHYGTIAHDLMKSALASACADLLSNARDAFAFNFTEQQEVEDRWLDEDVRGYGRWKTWATLADCVPKYVSKPDGYCWECEQLFSDPAHDHWAQKVGRFIRCHAHSRLVLACLPGDEE